MRLGAAGGIVLPVLGLFGLCWIGVKLGWAQRPEGVNRLFDERLGIIVGSLLSAFNNVSFSKKTWHVPQDPQR
jgi:cytochrome bd-type quinol oxidase subunit 1